MNRSLASLSFGLPFAMCLALGTVLAAGEAAAQDSGTTVVAKTPAPMRATAAGVLPAATAPQAQTGAPTAGAQEGSAQGSSAQDSSNAAEALKPAQDVQTGSLPPNQIPPPPPIQTSAPAGDVNNVNADQGAGWEAAVQAAPGPTPLLGDQREQAIKEINDYFNGITSLQGTFKQVDSDDKLTTGRFYVERPGKLRFDYDPPSPLRIVADGAYLSIEDSDLKTIEKYPIESTPFRLLLAKSVDLERDAKILGVAGDDDELSINLEDKNDEASGSIRLVFDTKPDLTLSQWVITDAQGLTTTVTLDDVGPGRKVAADFFQSRNSFSPYR
jgi:outer membrane lipoprotein-sorting protein